VREDEADEALDGHEALRKDDADEFEVLRRHDAKEDEADLHQRHFPNFQ
jgi:hypothetical protein